MDATVKREIDSFIRSLRSVLDVIENTDNINIVRAYMPEAKGNLDMIEDRINSIYEDQRMRDQTIEYNFMHPTAPSKSYLIN